MSENFLHYLWKFKKFETGHLTTSNKRTIEVLKVGQHNHNSGPDFFNAKIRIDDQLWVGNVEIHVKSSDWLLHQHDKDQAYDSVILHVVWKHDTEIRRTNNSIIPTLSLGEFASKTAIKNYKQLFYKKKNWINCETQISHIDHFIIESWNERLFFERLQRKSQEIEVLLLRSNNDWESVLFILLARSFGMKVNKEAFINWAGSFEYSLVRKLQYSDHYLEALFFGQAGFLEAKVQDIYFNELKHTFQFLKRKYSLNNSHRIPMLFFRMRPSNFPTIRLSQLAQLYYKNVSLFSKCMATQRKRHFYKIFGVLASDFWNTHYSFTKTSPFQKKSIGTMFIDHLLINTIIPLKFLYASSQAKDVLTEITDLARSIKSEKNKVINNFNRLKINTMNALESQAAIQLFEHYCVKNNCLNCDIGNKLLNRND